MRILIANDGVSDVGGVQTYLDAVVGELSARGHQVALAYCTDSGAADSDSALQQLPRFQVGGDDRDPAWRAIGAWTPDVCFSHNMGALDVDARLAAVAPVVKFMHGYFGTCISSSKSHAFPSPRACDRTFGPACLALFLPRRCGRLGPAVLLEQLRWARDQRRLFARYRSLVVASDHMGREYVQSGLPPASVHVNPLFPTRPVEAEPSPVPERDTVAFLGRMTHLKGGDRLVRAVRHAMDRLGRPIALLMMGDGPQRSEWEGLAAQLGVPATFTGWVRGPARWDRLRGCSLAAIPSVWPEPFGLVGLEAGALGVPAVAADVGGVAQWLRDGVNGRLVAAASTPDGFGTAIADVLADRTRQLRLRAGARQVALDLSLARHVDRLEPILAAAAAVGPARPAERAIAC